MMFCPASEADVGRQLLLIAGDVETNPGPVKPGLLKSFMKDLRSVHEKYASLAAGLGVPKQQIKILEKKYSNDHERLFFEVIYKWLNCCDEDEDYLEFFASEKKEVSIFITPRFSKGDYVHSLCKALKEIEEEKLAEVLKRKYECQQRLLQSLIPDLRAVEEKYVAIGVGLEVGLSEIHFLEFKYDGDKGKIFSAVLQCWLDNYSRDKYIQDLCEVLKAEDEASVAERIRIKYSTSEESFLTTPGLQMKKKAAQQPGEQEAPHHTSSSAPEADSHFTHSQETRDDGNDTCDGNTSMQDIEDDTPEMSQMVTAFDEPTRDKMGHAELDLIVPSNILQSHAQQLKDLEDTIQKNGDANFPLEIKGDKSTIQTIPWSCISWSFHLCTDPVYDTVKAEVTVKDDVLNDIAGIIKDGVQASVHEALDKKYQVEAELMCNKCIQ